MTTLISMIYELSNLIELHYISNLRNKTFYKKNRTSIFSIPLEFTNPYNCKDNEHPHGFYLLDTLQHYIYMADNSCFVSSLDNNYTNEMLHINDLSTLF